MSHAIVMGGSIAGLCAAAALARNFDRVTVIERDPAPQAEARRGAPQGRHTHALLRRGQSIMAQLFPGAFEALARAGANQADLGEGLRWFQFGAWKCRSQIGNDMWMQTRPLLEHCLRESLAGFANVEQRFDCPIDAPVHDDGRITGIRLRDGAVLDADVVVDATGRGSRAPMWLEQWGYGRVPEQRVSLGLAYVSGVFELPPGEQPEHALAVYHLPPHNRRCGWVFPIEGRRVIVTLVGYHGDHPPTELRELKHWARGLLRPDVAEVLDRAQLVGELSRYGYREQVRRSLRRAPQGYLVIGDALCSFDPTFGQGMTVAAMQAEQLLALRPGMSTRRFQRRCERITLLPFSMTANEAHRWHETTGWQPPLGAFQRWYIAKVFEASARDKLVYRDLIRVMHFLAGPASLAKPAMIKRLIADRLSQRRAPALAPGRSTGELGLAPALHQTGY